MEPQRGTNLERSPTREGSCVWCVGCRERAGPAQPPRGVSTGTAHAGPTTNWVLYLFPRGSSHLPRSASSPLKKKKNEERLRPPSHHHSWDWPLADVAVRPKGAPAPAPSSRSGPTAAKNSLCRPRRPLWGACARRGGSTRKPLPARW